VPEKVLVVEDDADIGQVVGEALRSDGYQVAMACHGAAALEYLEGAAAPPALILLDLAMPVLDGRGFMAELRRRRLAPGCPVVLVSADPEIARHAAELTADGFLRKPVPLDRLLGTVRRYASLAPKL